MEDFGQYYVQIDTELANILLQCCLFRLGGEQVFTAEEITKISKDVAGMRIKSTVDGEKQTGTLLLRLKLREV